MALFTDGTVSTLDDLRNYERAIFDVASTERIDLSRKLVAAQQEIGIELTEFLLQEAGQESGPGRADLGRVVVAAGLRQWHTLHALSLAYRDAYSSHLNDRYRTKWKEFERLSRWASTKCFDTGIGMVFTAIPKAEPPEVNAVAGTLGRGTYWASVAWANGAGEEGCASEPAPLELAEGSGLFVKATNPPAGVTGWNVYAGTALESMAAQNDAPLTLGSTWVTSEAGVRGGTGPGEGQKAAYFVVRRRVLQRG